jgi:hypothetical protein
VSGRIENRLAAGHGSSQYAGIFTDAGPKNITALLSQSLSPGYLGDVFGRSIETRNSPIQIDRENTFVDRIQDCFSRPSNSFIIIISC